MTSPHTVRQMREALQVIVSNAEMLSDSRMQKEILAAARRLTSLLSDVTITKVCDQDSCPLRE